MAEIKWTPSQNDAIHAQDGTVLVSAAAGSGKTAVLVARVIDLMTKENDPCGADEMLIVTFTKAAAAQMREKISKKLSEKIAERPHDMRLIKQRMMLSCAKICTIDSFCADVVRMNYHNTDISPDCRMLDEGERKSVKNEAFEETAELFYKDGSESFRKLCDMFSSAGDDSSLEETVNKLYEFSCAYPFPEEWLKKISESFCEDNFEWKRIIASYVLQSSQYCLESVRKAKKIMLDDEIIMQAYGDAFSEDERFFEILSDKAENCRSNRDWDKLYTTVREHKFPKLGAKKRGYESEAGDAVRVIRDKYKDVCDKKLKKLFCATADEDAQDIKSAFPVMKVLSDFVITFSKEYDKRKKQKNSADFSDILHAAISLLVRKTENGYEKTELALQYSEKFRYILIDEYQDTNYAQDMLFRAVSRDESNLFFVGDVKQSIYRFRQAMPDLFIKKRKAYNDFSTGKYPANITLGQNFRSRREITEWINFVFGQIMSENLGEIDYNDDESLVFSAPYGESTQPDVELDLIDRHSFSSESDKTGLEAWYIAQKVKQMLESDMTVSDGGSERKIKKGDICILLRSASGKALKYTNALRSMGIDACSGDSGNLFDTTEVKVMLSLLTVIDNPLNDVPLMSVLMSPIFGFTADDIADIRIKYGKKKSIYACIVSAADNGNTLCGNFVKKLSQYRLMSVSLSADELIDKLIEETGYADIVFAMRDGETRRDNLYILREYARTYSQSGNSGLMGFIRLMDKIRQQNIKLLSAPKASSSKDAVTVMTIHKSKGLEFPVCILANCSGKFNADDRKASLIVHSKYGVGIMGRDNGRMIRYETLNHTAVKLETEFSELSEEMRVLYVAMTRAREKLIMTVTEDNLRSKLKKLSADVCSEEISPFAVRNCGNYADWILMCALRHPDAGILRKMSETPYINVAQTQLPLKVNVIESVDECEDEEIIQTAADADEELKMINEKVSFVYPYAILSGIYAKRGASDAKKGLNKEFFASSRPAFLDSEGLSPAQKGTAMHLFMQHSDYRKAYEDIESEIERLKINGFLNEAEADSLDRSRLRGFFSSNLANRMFSSERVYREKKFIISMSPRELDDSLPENSSNESIIIQGILDCAFEENGKMVIVDYKTDRIFDENELRERYSDQLYIYTKAVKECMNMEVKETVLYSFWLGKEVKI